VAFGGQAAGGVRGGVGLLGAAGRSRTQIVRFGVASAGHSGIRLRSRSAVPRVLVGTG
jgi:hypothetical protein